MLFAIAAGRKRKLRPCHPRSSKLRVWLASHDLKSVLISLTLLRFVNHSFNLQINNWLPTWHYMPTHDVTKFMSKMKSEPRRTVAA